jgi:hypothetical protein
MEHTSPYEIRKIFMISTAHIPYVDDFYLMACKHSSEYSLPCDAEELVEYHDCGYTIAIEDVNVTQVFSHFSPAFVQVLALAQLQGCTSVTFDADAPKYDNLPTFDW